ncbi:protein sarah [Condylostylus longicornis]|uniref:protein sarah n=1 Tax=Condylostylus longicornis TaxID=2530218 RepID=UPI00244DCDC7|nr:protein sarah [Condylostylus longicornis]XP_055375252.1 protein sarah [Condylostylus longicornis]
MSSPKEEQLNDDRPNSTEQISPDENLFINASDGLSSQHPTLPTDLDSDDELNNDIDPYNFDDLPTSIIVTNIHSEVFTNDKLKNEMEDLFRKFSEKCTFQWLKSFRRLRVNYDNAISAANARIQLHQYEFHNKSVITCYFAQPVTPVAQRNLQPPALVKQFLISPPASPPFGWEPREENEPLVNHDLIAALANLTPGESHEIHPQTDDQPGIIVHTAILPKIDNGNESPNVKLKIQQTKCPDRN